MRMFLLGMQNEWYAWERKKKRNVTAVTPQFKTKYCLEQREFALVAYANFFEVSVMAKHKKKVTCWRKTDSSKDAVK